MSVYKSPYPSVAIPDESVFTFLFGSMGTRFPGSAPAFIDGLSGRVVSRLELKQLALSLAWGIRNQFAAIGGVPLTRGDTIMIFSPNSISWPIMLFASVAAGLKATLANTSYTPRELRSQYNDSGAKAIFVHPSLISVVLAMFELIEVSSEEAKKRVIIADWNEEPSVHGYVRLDDLMGRGDFEEEEKFFGSQAHETLFLCYSSGTTGFPKGVETTHKNIVSLCSIARSGFPFCNEKDVILGVLPFYHIYGAVKVLQFPFSVGATMVILPRFEPDSFCRSIEKYKVTAAFIVPPICLVLLRHPAVAKYFVKTLKWVISGAAPLGGTLVKEFYKRFLSAGADVKILQGYGLTETSPTTHVLTQEAFMTKVGSIGLLLSNLEARIVIDDTVEAKEGESGELWIRGPTVMKGYLNNIAATRGSITPDGWFKTGDVVTRDRDGFYYIVDRLKELIKYKGFQVPPAELEAVLLQHPDIADAAVIGVYSEKDATELPRAYIVPKSPLQTPQDASAFEVGVQEWIKSHVANHKYLRGGVVVIDAIPKSAAGKILRRQLRDLASEELEAKSLKRKL